MAAAGAVVAFTGNPALLIVAAIVALAWRTLSDPDLFRAIITFIALGLLIALAWVRLQAPDVALAEAAIGSGLTGAMLLSASARTRRRELSARPPEPPEAH